MLELVPVDGSAQVVGTTSPPSTVGEGARLPWYADVHWAIVRPIAGGLVVEQLGKVRAWQHAIGDPISSCDSHVDTTDGSLRVHVPTTRL